ncbi:hypothetical protein JTE90_016290 [Oedothorax gibbosus]|uniref:Tetraspanin n=1 Tax=Oedothorax gibbosus TaxID=931172 RepID=A0AAV6U3R2_9ARAC|nr:hypothetical protein JTE90_016290 [Oedothorax gibbosus]
MVKGGVMTFVKYAIFIFNVMFVVGGMVLVAEGIIIYQKKGLIIFADAEKVHSQPMPIIAMCLGSCIAVMAVLGCCGAWRETPWKLLLYGLLLFALCVCQITAMVMVQIHRKESAQILKAGMWKSLQQQKWDQLKVWNTMQTEWECCGVEGPKDYEDKKMKVPGSCCKPTVECNVSEAFNKGCYKKLLDFLNKKLTVFGGLGGLIAVTELTGAVFTFCLVRAVWRERRETRRQRAAQRQPPNQPQI